VSAADNKALLQAIFARIEQGDRALLEQHLADNFRIVVMGCSSWSQTVTGRALVEYRAYLRSRFSAPGRSVAERFIADGDVVVVETRGNNYSASGERYDNQYCLIFRFDNGKIVEMREYMDTAFCERVLGVYPRAAQSGM
jgi:ketosteroid isomerase-like protein